MHTAPQVDVADYQSTIANMTDHILLLEEKLNKLVRIKILYLKLKTNISTIVDLNRTVAKRDDFADC